MDGEKVFTRLIDAHGRFEVPQDIREVLGWKAGTRLEVGLVDVSIKSIILREVSARCSLCRRKSENLTEIGEGYICPYCVAQIK